MEIEAGKIEKLEKSLEKPATKSEKPTLGGQNRRGSSQN
jgi:hypothetical protein